MTFAVPSHLPRQAFSAQDQSLSSESHHYDSILAKLDTISSADLHSTLVSSWVAQLTKEIDETRSAIHQRIRQNLPIFEKQLQTSKRIVERAHSLESDAERLTNSVCNEENGLLPALSRQFGEHAILVQRMKDAEILERATTHAFKCRDALQRLSAALHNAQLAESAAISEELEALLQDANDPLPRTDIFQEIKNRFRILYDTLQERLSDAYARALKFESSPGIEKLTITPTILIPPSTNEISILEICTALQAVAVDRLVNGLRKTLSSKFVEPLIWSKATVSVANNTLILRHQAVDDDVIVSLSALVGFLRSHLLNSLPRSCASQLLSALIPPLQSSLLDRLKRSIPSSPDALSDYIGLVARAVEFEDSIVREASLPRGQLTLSKWATSLSSHYEKKRRDEILQNVRSIIINNNLLGGIRVTKSVAAVAPNSQGTSSGVNGEHHQAVSTSADVPLFVPAAAAQTASSHLSDDDEDDGWGFDEDDVHPNGDETEAAELTRPSNLSFGESISTLSEDAKEPDGEVGEDPWDEEDPWGDDSAFGDPPAVASSLTSPTFSAPKSAKGLEKFSSRSKSSEPSNYPDIAIKSLSSSQKNGLGAINRSLPPDPTSLQSPSVSLAPASSVAIDSPIPAFEPIQETFIVSECAVAVLGVLEACLEEGKQLANSQAFVSHNFLISPSSDKRSLGSLIISTAGSILDLFYALVPVVRMEMMDLSPSLRMRFSNDCLYLSSEVLGLSKAVLSDVDRAVTASVDETIERFSLGGELWFEAALHRSKNEIDAVLRRAHGFSRTVDDAQSAIDEDIVDSVADILFTVAPDWKAVLPPSSYLDACSFLVEETLSSILNDILSLPDIPEAESHRLNALCQRLDRLKELFVLAPGEGSVVGSFVPSWFKFAYTAELLEASLADITYLFETGALIDFEREELIRLVQGLFSDTPLRAKTIEKIRTATVEMSE